MNRYVHLFPLLLAALGVLLPAVARAEEKEALTWYAVELIVFERVSEAGRSAELWPADPGLPDIAGAIELSAQGLTPQALAAQSQTETIAGAPAVSALALAPPPAAAARPFQLVPPAEYRLTDAWHRLEKSAAYRPLLHLAWIQPGYSADNARPVHVRNDNAALGALGASSGEAPTPGFNEPGYAPTLSSRVRVARDRSKAALDGTVRVHRARYLHVQVDLLYYRPLDSDAGTAGPADGGAAAAAPLPDSPDTALTEQLMAETDTTPRLFRLKESRRMRSSELHYLDHPLFGALVEIWPLELPDAVQAAPETSAPADTGVKSDEGDTAQPPPVLPAPPAGGSGG